ncbi:MAG: TetR/AcrR family transcriptional regulator [Acidobacteria bacterium]|nr:TetR/AcrR family transcriptional regulator [Acidobacteriota bacterium]
MGERAPGRLPDAERTGPAGAIVENPIRPSEGGRVTDRRAAPRKGAARRPRATARRPAPPAERAHNARPARTSPAERPRATPAECPRTTPADRARAAELTREFGEQGERTRRALLTAAQEVFRERGYHAARVDDITARAGTSHGAFYLYFSNKSEILEALAAETSEQLHDLSWKLEDLESGDAAYETLRKWVGELVDLYLAHAPVIAAWIEAEPGSPRFERLGRDVLAKVTRQVGRVVRAASDPRARRPLDPAVAATAIVAMLERFCYFWLARGAEFEREQAVDTLAGIMYRTIVGTPLR